MLTEFRNDGITDMLKTVYPPKTPFCGGYKNPLGFVIYNILSYCCHEWLPLP